MAFTPHCAPQLQARWQACAAASPGRTSGGDMVTFWMGILTSRLFGYLQRWHSVHSSGRQGSTGGCTRRKATRRCVFVLRP